MIKSFLLLALSLFFMHPFLIAQEVSIEHVHTIDFKTTENLAEIDLQGDIAVDHEGNKIIVGSFWGKNVAFDETSKISSNGNKNIFIAKYDSENTILWLKNIGGETILMDFGILANQANDAATAVAIDTNNNIYVLTKSNLNSEQIVDYDAVHVHTNSILETGYDRNEQIVFAKYTSDGELLWIRTIGDIFDDKAYKLVLDKNNEIWITGTMGGYSGNQIDFDKDRTHPANEDILVGQFGHLGFIAHYDNDGNFISVKGIGGGSTYFTHLNMYPGAMGNLYLTGSISAYSTQLFLEDTNPHILNSNGRFELWPQNEDAFVIKYSNEGDIKWIKMIGNAYASYVSDLIVDELENIYIAGWFSGTIDFDSDKTLDYDTKTAAGKGSGYVAKYNSDGELEWLNTIKGGTLTQVKTLELFNERLVLGGNFQGSNIQFGNTFQSSSINSDSFISIISTSGDWINTEFLPSADHSSITQLDIEPNGTIHFLGYNADTYVNMLNMSKIFFGEIKNALQAPTAIETKSDYSILVYPNPTQNFIHVKSTTPIEVLELYSISGDLIWFRKNEQKEDIDMRNKSQGIYLLKVHFVNGQTKTIKVVKK